jgi:4-hydroxybenzoyl-CoA thioesterase
MHGPLRAGVPTARISAEFHAPSRLGEVLDLELRPRRIGRSSCEIAIEAACGGERRMSVSQTIVWIAMATGRSQPWPEELKRRIERQIEEGDATWPT